MALYLGSNKKFKVRIGENKKHFYIGSPMSSSNNIRLLSNDGYILKDLNGLYLIPKQEVSSNVNGI
jgi:hypothetical protein